MKRPFYIGTFLMTFSVGNNESSLFRLSGQTALFSKSCFSWLSTCAVRLQVHSSNIFLTVLRFMNSERYLVRIFYMKSVKLT